MAQLYRHSVRAKVHLRQQGSVLIEVLVAFLIFAFGVLGLVGLQGAMLRNQTDAKFRTDAAFLANEFVGLAASDAKTQWASYVTSAGSVCSYSRCKDWVAKVASGLPSGTATVTYVYASATESGTYTLTLKWTMPDGTTHQYLSVATVTK